MGSQCSVSGSLVKDLVVCDTFRLCVWNAIYNTFKLPCSILFHLLCLYAIFFCLWLSLSSVLYSLHYTLLIWKLKPKFKWHVYSLRTRQGFPFPAFIVFYCWCGVLLCSRSWLPMHNPFAWASKCWPSRCVRLCPIFLNRRENTQAYYIYYYYCIYYCYYYFEYSIKTLFHQSHNTHSLNKDAVGSARPALASAGSPHFPLPGSRQTEKQ